MNKLKLAGAVGGAVVVALCWPLAVGQIGQNVITDGLKNMSDGSVKAELISYQRGYLSSEMQTRYTIVDKSLARQLQADGLPAEFVVDSHVRHGFISLNSHSVLSNFPDLPLTMDSNTALNGNTDYTITLDNWHYQGSGDNAAAVSVTPVTLKGTTTVLGELTYELNAPSVQLDFDNGENITLTNITGSGQGKKSQSFWVGEQQVAIGSMKLIDETGQELIHMNDASYQFNSSMDQGMDRFSSHHKVKAGQLKFTDGQVDDLNIDFQLGEVDRESFEKVYSLYQNNAQMDEQEMAKVAPYVNKLFSKGFYIAMNQMSAKVNDGGVTSKWKLEVPEGTDNVLADPGKILTVLTGNMDTTLSN